MFVLIGLRRDQVCSKQGLFSPSAVGRPRLRYLKVALTSDWSAGHPAFFTAIGGASSSHRSQILPF